MCSTDVGHDHVGGDDERADHHQCGLFRQELDQLFI